MNSKNSNNNSNGSDEFVLLNISRLYIVIRDCGCREVVRVYGTLERRRTSVDKLREAPCLWCKTNPDISKYEGPDRRTKTVKVEKDRRRKKSWSWKR